MTKPEVLTRDQVLRRLADHLDDAVLMQLFPGERPQRLRRLICDSHQEQGQGILAPPSPASFASNPRGCRLFTDGASRGNPGRAGAGAVLLAPAGEEMSARSEYLGICTNNVAEYRALLLGLDEALRHGCEELVIALDSELIVRQIQGRYKVKNETLLPLFQQVQQRLSRLRKWSIMHVPRAQNSRADQLANRGIDDRDD
ncbi:ribonuclease HI family protein [Desulfobulbus propionicus]